VKSLYTSHSQSFDIDMRVRYTDWMIGSSTPGRSWEFFSSPPRPDRLRGPHSLLYDGYAGSFSGVKRPGLDADHSSPSSSEVKNARSYTSTPPIRLHGLMLSRCAGTTLPLPLQNSTLEPEICKEGLYLPLHNKFPTTSSFDGVKRFLVILYFCL
jgi:hypothetical protein